METKIVQMADDLTSTTSVETAGILIAENLLTTSEFNGEIHTDNETSEFNGEIHSCNSEGLIQKIEK